MSFLIFLLLAGLISPALIPPRAACTVSANVVQVIELAPAVSEQLSQAQLPYTFLQLRIEVDYTPGQRALLASSPDGLGEPFTDDVMYLRARPSGKVFQHDFRSADRMAVGSIPPQDITFLFEPGVNTLELSTQDLTRVLEDLVQEHQPPLVRGRRIKLRYAHMGGLNPPTIVIHGNQVDALPGSYQRYLENYFREALGLVGTPIRLELRQSENPYAGRRNKLTPRQQAKRRRLMQHVKRKK